MKLGLYSINMGACVGPAPIAAAARDAEAAGFESLWAGEHIVLPDPQAPPSPMAPQAPALDAIVALTWAAAVTRTVRLATGVIILPQRNPVVLAKELASLDVLSEGRSVFGVGVGYLEPEFATIGANFRDRGAAADEHLDVMEHLWYDEHPEHHGTRFDFRGIDAHPRPVQSPIPIVVGGRTAPAFRRAVRRGNGWFGFRLDPEQLAVCLRGIQAAEAEVERPDALGDLELTVSPPGRLTPEMATEYAELGIDRIVTVPPPTPDGVTKAIDGTLAATAHL